ncbi:hypothetical protein AAHN97_02975 [Chitinophaga niabensis]|uniref:hypothetical protein n=1 Tax=Chitinophaga niabensis TaxID=536979 RepID=UPI0031BAFED7
MKYLLYTCMLFLLFACKKNRDKGKEPVEYHWLVGKWKLKQSAISTGGPLEIRPADPNNPVYIEFKSDGQFSASPAVANGNDHYRIDSNRISLTSTSRPTAHVLKYVIGKELLILYPIDPACIEGCYNVYTLVR